jgi:hypothetical protein
MRELESGSQGSRINFREHIFIIKHFKIFFSFFNQIEIEQFFPLDVQILGFELFFEH